MADSSTLPSENATEKVRTGRVLCLAIIATSSDESMPPDKNAPMGTSLIIWRCTAFSRSCSSSNSSGVVTLASAIGGDQYRPVVGSQAPADHWSQLPDSSLRTPLKIVRGTGI